MKILTTLHYSFWQLISVTPVFINIIIIIIESRRVEYHSIQLKCAVFCIHSVIVAVAGDGI